MKGNPKRTSAELNTLLRMAERAEREGLDVDSIALIPTDTDNCLLCAEVVEWYLESEGYRAWRTEPVRAPEEPEDFWMGLNDLIDRLETTGVTDPSRNVWVAATPGFKPEAAILTLVASLFGKPVFYVHETMHDLVEIPPAMPIVTDPEFVASLIRLRRELGDGVDTDRAKKILNELARNERDRERYKLFLVEDPHDGKFKPSPLTRLAGPFLALGVHAAGARNYRVRIKGSSGHTVPVERGGRVTKADEAELRELPLEDDTLEVLATIAAFECVGDTWHVVDEWTVEGTKRHDVPVKVQNVHDDAVIVAIRDRRVHISKLRIPTEDPETVRTVLKHLAEAFAR